MQFMTILYWLIVIAMLIWIIARERSVWASACFVMFVILGLAVFGAPK